MTFEIEVGSCTRSVSVQRGDRPDTYRVSIDGRSLEVQARRVGELGLVLVTDPDQQVPQAQTDKTNGRNEFGSHPAARQVFLTAAGASGGVVVTYDGRTTEVTLNGRRSQRAAETPAHTHGDQSVTAPMPGRVLRVLVAAGDAVSAGQGLVVVEAMKMENELRAPRAGRVKDVSVSAGASVDAGRVLVVIE
ncbi:MAG: biotin/lipoyl-containing protein [Vicinamibacterales bacterium]